MSWTQVGTTHVLVRDGRHLGWLTVAPGGGWRFTPAWKSGRLGPWASLDEAKAAAEREAQEA